LRYQERTITSGPAGFSAPSDPKVRASVLGGIPSGCVAESSDVFDPVVFLASDACGSVNGHTPPVDGGWLGG